MAASMLDNKCLAMGQLPQSQEDISAQPSSTVKCWSPLIVPMELYKREGLAWQSHQPVSLTVEVNGKRDLMKYAAVMQMVPKLGFVTRLGQPGAAAKFKNLHLIDVQRRGSTDIHMCLGDWGWSQSHSPKDAAVMPPTQHSAAVARPEINEAGMVAQEMSVLEAGGAEGGLLSGSSSEGSDGARSAAAEGTDLDAVASTKSHSQGDVASDPDDKAAVTSSAVVRSAGGPTSCSAIVAGDASTAMTIIAPGMKAAFQTIAAAAAEAPCTGGTAGVSTGGLQGPSSVAIQFPSLCACAFCPCHLDHGQLETATSDNTSITDSSPNNSLMASRQAWYSKEWTVTSERPFGSGSLTMGSSNGRLYLPLTAAPGSDAGGAVSHMSYERLRKLAIDPMLKCAASAVMPKADSSRSGDSGRPPLNTSALLPQRLAAHSSASLSAPAGSIRITGDSAGAGIVKGAVALQLISRELIVPPALAVKRMSDTHAHVRCEIDGEVEDCKMLFRLVRSADGRTLSLQGISRPLYGLHLLSMSEADDGELFIRAVTPGTAPDGGCMDMDRILGRTLGPTVAGAVSVAAREMATAKPAAAAAANPQIPNRSSAGRQRRPSLKVREGAMGGDTLVGAGRARTAAGKSKALPPLYALSSATVNPLYGTPLLAQQLQQEQHGTQLHQHQHVQQAKRRSRPPRGSVPDGAPPAPLLLPVAPSAQMQVYKRQQPQARLMYLQHVSVHDALNRDQCDHDGHAVCDVNGGRYGDSVKRIKTVATNAGRAGPLTMPHPMAATMNGKEHADVHGADRRDYSHHGCRAAAQASSLATLAMQTARQQPILGDASGLAVLTSGQACRTSNLGSDGILSPLLAVSREEISADADNPLHEVLMQAPAPSRQLQQMQPRASPGAARAATPAAVCGRHRRKRGSSLAQGRTAGIEAVATMPAIAGRQLDFDARQKRFRVCSESIPQEAVGEIDATGQDSEGDNTQEESLKAAAWEWGLSTAGHGRVTVSHCAKRRAKEHLQQVHMPSPSYSFTSCEAVYGSEGGCGALALATASGDADRAAGGIASGGFLGGGAVVDAMMVSEGSETPRNKQLKARLNVSKSKGKSNRHPSKISNVIRNAGAILLMIGPSPVVYEKQLRATFGNNPDTSKALRLLEEQGRVMRGGLGYRMHPYHYTLTPSGLLEYEQQLAEQGPSHAFALAMGVQLPMSGRSPPAVVAENGNTTNTSDGYEEAAAAVEGNGSGAAVSEKEMGLKMEAQSAEEFATAAVEVFQQQVLQPQQLQPAVGLTQQPLAEALPSAAPAIAANIAITATSDFGGPEECQLAQPVPAAQFGAGPLLSADAAVEGVGAVAPCKAPALDWNETVLDGCSSRSPSLSAQSTQHSCQQRPVNSNSGMPIAAEGASLSLTPTVSVSPTAVPVMPLPNPAVPLLQQPQHLQGHQQAAGAVTDSARQHQLIAPAIVWGSLPGPHHQAHHQEVLRAQTDFACPSGYQQACITPCLPVADEAGKNGQESAGTSSGSAQKPYAVYNYLPTQSEFMPYAMYGTCAYPANSNQQLPTGSSHSVALDPHDTVPCALVQSLPPVLPSQFTQQQQEARADAKPAAMVTVDEPQTASERQSATLVISPPLPRMKVEAEEHIAPLPLMQVPVLEQSPVLFGGTSIIVPLHSQQSSLPTFPSLPSEYQHPSEPQPPPAPDRGLPPQQQPSIKYRYVGELVGGGYRAEVPSVTGVMYYSPCFASSLHAAAAVDLLMAKLRPTEPLNLGINAQEAATLASYSIEQIQAMLWTMADRR